MGNTENKLDRPFFYGVPKLFSGATYAYVCQTMNASVYIW